MKEQIHIYVEKEVKEKLEQLAEKDGRSLNNLINKVLKNHVQNRELAEKLVFRKKNTFDDIGTPVFLDEATERRKK